MKKIIYCLLVILSVILAAGCVNQGGTTNQPTNTGMTEEKPKVLTISTTTSVYNTGLTEALAQKFKKDYNIILKFIPNGTGGAIKDAESGASDAIIVHAVSEEAKFLNEGYGVNRKVFAYNFFIIVGPKDDPAHIKGLNPIEALKRIYKAGEEGKAIWVSRDDKSGTNVKEITLWKLAGYNYDELKTKKWFRTTGEGMGDTLKYTNEVKGYTLSDIATFLVYKKEGIIPNLEKLVDKGESLTNVYAIIIVNPNKIKGKDFKTAMFLEKWLVSEKGQKFLEEFGKDKYGTTLFYPAVNVLEEKKEPIYKWIVKNGFIKEGDYYYECPEKFIYNTTLKFFKFPVSEIEG